MTLIEVVSKNLKELMRKRDLSISMLSKISGVSESTIRNLLNIKVKTIKIRTLIKLADALIIRLDDFLVGYKYEKINCHPELDEGSQPL